MCTVYHEFIKAQMESQEVQNLAAQGHSFELNMLLFLMAGSISLKEGGQLGKSQKPLLNMISIFSDVARELWGGIQLISYTEINAAKSYLFISMCLLAECYP